MVETTDFLPGGGTVNIGNDDEPWKELHAENIYSGGHSVVRSINNQYADDKGNINISGSSDTGGIDCGMIIPFAGNNNIPVGFLLCNGASVRRDTYPDLFKVIGTTYGSVDDEHFNIPDLRGKFIEGADEAGNYKEAGLPNIDGSVTNGVFDDSSSATGSFNLSDKTSIRNGSNSSTLRFCTLSTDASRSNPIYGNSDTVQPPSLTVRYIVKAFAGTSSSTADIEVTQLANDLADKANRALTNTADNVDFVVESYSDENGSWYRKYKSGWVEQSSVFQSTESSSTTFATIIITLLLPMANTNYMVNKTEGVLKSNYSNQSVFHGHNQAWSLTTTSFTTGYAPTQNAGLSNFRWYVCGKGAEE